jgi:uncharacterized RDD family membrane protein YckC
LKKITIITPANIEVEYRLAGVGSRLSAFIIDYTIQILLTLLAAGIILLGYDRWFLGNRTPSGFALGMVLMAYFLINFGYYIVTELTMNGQTLGKKVFALRAIRENGQPIGFSHILIRAIFRASIDMLYIGIFFIMFSKLDRRLGDMAAGTVVVSEHALGADEFIFHEHSAQEMPEFLLAYAHNLSAEEQRIVDEWLRRKTMLPDGGEKIRLQLEEYFGKKKI